MKGCQFDKNFPRFQSLIMHTRTGRHEWLAISFPQGYKIGYGAPITLPTYAKASVGHPPVCEIRRSMWMHCRGDSTQGYAFLHDQGRGLLRRRMKVWL
jgi:hypothetical protein